MHRKLVLLLILPVLLSIVAISCGGPRVVIHDSELPSNSDISKTTTVSPNRSGSQTSTRSGRQQTFAAITSLPTLKGGNRALRKKITYPDEAIQNGIEGTVRVQFIIDGEGQTSDIILKEGIGNGCDEAVIRAIRDSEFEPGRGPDGAGIRFMRTMAVEFTL